MLQKVKTWDFTARFLIKQNRLNRTHKPGTPSYKKEMSSLGAWTKERLIDLGPTYIKLGQLASTRRDVYTPEFIEELQTLQDQVPPIPEDDVVDILDTELSGLYTVFSTIDTSPFKSASLGQVHKARLLNGKEVVVKVQRPNIKDIVDRDITNILEVLTLLEIFGVETGPSAKDIFIEASTYLYNELDYEIEAQNCLEFYNNFQNVPWVRIPRVYKKTVTKKVFIMEYVEGTKITEINQNRPAAAKALVVSFLTQLMIHGFFHGDPHPGNVAINKDRQLVYYDFGLVVRLPDGLKEQLVGLLPLIVQKDTRRIVDSLIAMNLIVPTAEKSEIIMFIDAAVNYLENMDGKEFNAQIAQDELSKSLADEKPFQIPPDFLFLAKSFTTIDGICRQLDPKFNFVDYIEPMIVEEVQNSINIGEMTRASMEMPTRIRSISESLGDMEKSRLKIKRSIEKSRTDMKSTQYTLLSAMVADNVREEPLFFGFFVILTVYFLITGQKTRQ